MVGLIIVLLIVLLSLKKDLLMGLIGLFVFFWVVIFVVDGGVDV